MRKIVLTRKRPLTKNETRIGFAVKKTPAFGCGIQLSKNRENIAASKAKRGQIKNYKTGK